MQKKIEQFIFLSERILLEPGELRLRPTWSSLQNVSNELSSYIKQLSFNFETKYALLFLLSISDENQQKNGCMSLLFRKILTTIPSRELLLLLSAVSRVELNTYLLPFLYESGNIGSVAAYTAAKLGLKVKYDAFEFFLNSREWSQKDLINLSLLSLSDEKQYLIANINQAYQNSHKEVFRDFAEILQTSNKAIGVPQIPELGSGEASNKNNIVVQEEKNTQPTATAQKPVAPTVKRAAVPSKNSIQKSDTEPESFVNKIKNYSQNVSDKIRNNNLSIDTDKVGETLKNSSEELSNFSKSDDSSSNKKLFIGIGSSVAIIALLLAVFSLSQDNENSSTEYTYNKTAKIPNYWVDAVTNKHLTPKYLEADVDYRMGELYLTRSLYDEAIRFFQYALKTEPKHLSAKLRWGYVEMLQGNYFAAKKLLKEVQADEPKLKNVNLYLARTAALEKKFDEAKSYYKQEYKLYNELSVGMEYANFLADNGKHNEAMEQIAFLQEKFPDKMLVLDSNKDESSDSKTEGDKNE